MLIIPRRESRTGFVQNKEEWRKVDKKIQDEIRTLQKTEDEFLNQLMQVRKKIKTKYSIFHDLSLYHEQTQTKKEQVKDIEAEIKDCTSREEMENLVQGDLGGIVEWLEKDQKEAIADAKKKREDSDKISLTSSFYPVDDGN